jgi:hypothetical protein
MSVPSPLALSAQIRSRRKLSPARELAFVLALYSVLTCVMTWPLVSGLTRDVPGDLGDSLLNMWILGWGAESVPRLLTGGMTPADFANANIFHPEPLALAFSEHLFAQVIQILPVYHLTGNLILCYNLLFLGTFLLSGAGMYLLVRDMTGSRTAAFFAGLVFAFVPYRVAQISHLQVLSSQWMPFVLFGFRRYITAGSRKGLTGGSAALLMQNWSCGYHLLYFAPFVVLFVVHQVITSDRWREARVWLAFTGAAVVVAAGTLPFLWLYLEAQWVHGFERPFAEIVGYSGDVFSYFTASESLRLLGRVMQAWRKPEGELFLGFVPMIVATAAVIAALRESWRDRALPSHAAVSDRPLGSRFVTALAATGVVVFCALLVGLIAILLTGGFVVPIGPIQIRATNARRLLTQLALLLTLALIASARVRHAAGRFVGSPAGFAAIAFLIAVWLSLGPIAHSRGERIEGIGLYGVLLEHVPGFEGLRVPARFAMIAALFLSLLSGVGIARLLKLHARPATVAAVSLLSIAFLAESAFAPMPLNLTWGDGGVVPPARVMRAAEAPAVYRHLATLPGHAAVAELPFGDPAWELRYVYYSTVHWKRILNGYSGGFPQPYKVRVARLQRYRAEPDEAWNALQSAGTTHVIVHEAAMPPEEAQSVRNWLETHGAREVGRFDRDVLYDLRHAP